MKNKYAHYYILLLITFLPVFVAAADTLDSYKEWMKLSTEELLKRGKACEAKESMDSALVFYSLVSNRSDVAETKKDYEHVCYAYVEKAVIYFSYFYNYSKAYENILAAQELKDISGYDFCFVDNMTAIFYNILSVMCRDINIEQKAISYCRKAYDTARANSDRDNMNVYFTNMLLISANLNNYSVLDETYKTYCSEGESSYNYKFNITFYNYLKSSVSGNYTKAVSEAKKMLKSASDSSDVKRMMMSFTSLIDIYSDKEDYDNAFYYVNKEEELAKQLKMRDHLIELQHTKSELYRKMGMRDKSDSCQHHYLLQKDSLLNMQQMNTISRALFDGKSRKIEKELEKISIKNNIYNKVFVFAAVFVIVLILMVVLLYIKIKQLKKSNITIYENNEENIKHEEKERQKLKNEIIRLEKDMGESVNKSGVRINNNDEEKYKNNYLTDDDKKKLLDKILTIMDDVDEICSESFSVTRLAELVGSKNNYVSLVINENYGCNFNNFLNKFRIKEACRRLADDENYGQYTIDSISNSLGFKSRTTLTTSFKKIVGLTPSQYRDIAKSKKKNADEVQINT